jgi:phosphatidate cytidylyltransferase
MVIVVGGWALTVAVALLTVQCAREYGAVVRLPRSDVGLLLAAGVVTTAVATSGRAELVAATSLGVFLVTSLMSILSGDVDDAHRTVGSVVFGQLFAVVPLACAVLLRGSGPRGAEPLLTVLAAVWLSDCREYVVGSSIRGRQLAPTVSPGKTWNGLAGSLIGTVVGILVLALLLPLPWRPAVVVPFAILLAAYAVFGDLIESLVKRNFGTKDAGSALPGFGGFLDRFDSLMVALPVAYLVTQVAHLAG